MQTACDLSRIRRFEEQFQRLDQIRSRPLNRVALARNAEGGTDLSQADADEVEKTMSVFFAIVLTENLRRAGWIELEAFLSLDPRSSISYRITALGWANQDSFRSHLQ